MGEKILSDIEAIKSGNMAKNARIAKALDSLKPTMDYHEYSGNQ